MEITIGNNQLLEFTNKQLQLENAALRGIIAELSPERAKQIEGGHVHVCPQCGTMMAHASTVGYWECMNLQCRYRQDESWLEVQKTIEQQRELEKEKTKIWGISKKALAED